MGNEPIPEVVPRHECMTDDIKMALTAVLNGAKDIRFEGEGYDVTCTDSGPEAIIRVRWTKTDDD